MKHLDGKLVSVSAGSAGWCRCFLEFCLNCASMYMLFCGCELSFAILSPGFLSWWYGSPTLVDLSSG